MVNNWDQHQKLVLDKLDEHGKKIDDQSELITDVRIELAKLKVRASIWGTIAGFIGAAVLMFIRGVI